MEELEMKKYKIGRKLTDFICPNCGQEANKPTTEYNRNVKLGRNSFCSRGCAVSYNNKHRTHTYSSSDKNIEHLKTISNNHRDEYTPFRYTLRNAKKRFKEFNLDLEYLKELWENQKGICPYTKIKLKLPEYKTTVEDARIRASLDRIDSSQGYIKGNVQFVSTPINYMKNDLSHEETIEFLKTIITNLSFDKDQTIS